MNTLLIDYFGVAVKTNKNIKDSDKYYIQSRAFKLGYIIHPDCCNDDVLEWIETKQINFNSTFYKTWEDVTSKNRIDLLLDQLINYAITYGRGEMFSMNDSDYSLVPDIRKFKVITPVTIEEMAEKCLGVLKTGIALKQETVLALSEFLLVNKINFDVNEILNKEAQAYICCKSAKFPKDKFALLRCIMYFYTCSTMLIKDRETIFEITHSSRDFDFSLLSQEQMKQLSSIFYRFKPLFLAMKSSNTASFINRLRRMAKKNHQPMVAGFWETIINKPCWLDVLRIRLIEDNPSNFKLIQLIQAIRDNRKLFMNHDKKQYQMYIIRNGKSYIKETKDQPVISAQYEWWDILEDVLYKTLVSRLKEKACTVKFPSDFNLACPSSEKNFIGNIPFGSYYDMTEHNMFGIYWRGEWGTDDFDLSFVDFNGGKYGWNSSFYDRGRNIIYSGDMTRANPEAAEVMYIKKNCPDGIIKVSRYSGDQGSKFIFAVAQNNVTYLPENYMMDPNTIKMQSEVISNMRETTIGFILNQRMYICNLQTGNSRVSNTVDNAYNEMLERKSSSFLDLKKLLLDAGFQERKRDTKDNPIELDLSNVNKDTLIKLFT